MQFTEKQEEEAREALKGLSVQQKAAMSEIVDYLRMSGMPPEQAVELLEALVITGKIAISAGGQGDG